MVPLSSKEVEQEVHRLMQLSSMGAFSVMEGVASNCLKNADLMDRLGGDVDTGGWRALANDIQSLIGKHLNT